VGCSVFLLCPELGSICFTRLLAQSTCSVLFCDFWEDFLRFASGAGDGSGEKQELAGEYRFDSVRGKDLQIKNLMLIWLVRQPLWSSFGQIWLLEVEITRPLQKTSLQEMQLWM